MLCFMCKLFMDKNFWFQHIESRYLLWQFTSNSTLWTIEIKSYRTQSTVKINCGNVDYLRLKLFTCTRINVLKANDLNKTVYGVTDWNKMKPVRKSSFILFFTEMNEWSRWTTVTHPVASVQLPHLLQTTKRRRSLRKDLRPPPPPHSSWRPPVWLLLMGKHLTCHTFPVLCLHDLSLYICKMVSADVFQYSLFERNEIPLSVKATHICRQMH